MKQYIDEIELVDTLGRMTPIQRKVVNAQTMVGIAVGVSLMIPSVAPKPETMRQIMDGVLEESLGLKLDPEFAEELIEAVQDFHNGN